MARLTMRNSVSLSATVSLLGYVRDIGVDWSKSDSFIAQLERFRFVDYVEDRHQFWMRLELETADPETAKRRIESVLAKAERLLGRYRKESR